MVILDRQEHDRKEKGVSSPPFKGIGIPGSVKFLLVESGIWGKFAYGILNPGLLNLKYSSKNLEYRIPVPLIRSGTKCLESGAYGMESRIQECLVFPDIGRHNFTLRLYTKIT